MRSDENSESRVGHEASPPILPGIGNILASQPRGIHRESRRQLVGRHRALHIAGSRLAPVASRIAHVLVGEPVQVDLGVELKRGVWLAMPVVHLHVGGFLLVQDVVHCYPPGRAAGVRAVGAKGRPRGGAGAVPADVRRGGPGHPLAVEAAVSALRPDAHPVGYSARGARGVVEDVVPRRDRTLERRHQVLQRGGRAVEVRRQIVIESR
mmetsp:Transcript_81311/g.212245  ORF Transcript_81311/g.212245 Transcript_81311/m.212245 type:complete len:209 (-) Transcript_81311:398-1024(-)